MRRKWLLSLSVFLVVLGLLVLSLSNASSTTSDKILVNQAADWTVTGYFHRNDKMFIEIKANREWGDILGDEELEVRINVSIIADDGKYVNITSYYHVYPYLGMSPQLEPLNATVVGRSSDFPMSIEEVQDYLGGIVRKDGNFTVEVNKMSIFSNFLSDKPPNPINLRKSEILYPYESLFFFGIFLAVTGACLGAGSWIFSGRRKVTKRSKERRR